MNRVAIYIRRSTEEHQIASLEVQEQEARRYVDAKGWTVVYLFADDAKSRAEFKKRPGLIGLLNAAVRREFDAVVTRDDSRLGGDTYRTGIVIQDLLDNDARLFYYYTDEEVRLDSAVDKFLVAARSFAAELEREKTSQRTHEHLLTKARRGLVVGGKVFGYDNHPVFDGDRRIRVEYRINEAEAEIVRDIFRRYAAGEGLRAIAKELNLRGIPAPRAGKRGTGSWGPSSLRSMLRRERYIGVISWGRMEKTYRGGTKVRIQRATSDITVVQTPHLRIVDDDLWRRVQEREGTRAQKTGWKNRGAKPRYLLSGLARCGKCGGPMHVANAKISHDNVRVYVCAWHRDRGNAVCDNGLRRPVASVEAVVVEVLQAQVLKEDLVVAVLGELRKRIEQRAASIEANQPTLQAEARKLATEIERLAAAIAVSEAKPAALVKAIDDRQQRLEALEARIRTEGGAPRAISLEQRRLERVARQRLGAVRELLGRNPDEGRRVVEAFLRGPLTLEPIETPEGKRFQIRGEMGQEKVLRTEEYDHVPTML